MRHAVVLLLSAVVLAGAAVGVVGSSQAAAPRHGHGTGDAGVIDAAWADPAARARAIAAGAPVFARHCASCHGTDGKGTSGAHAPDLTDDRWLFGGEDIDTFLIRASDIAFTVRHGIRGNDPATRNLAVMPALGEGHSLDADEVAAVTEYVLKLSGQPYDASKIAAGQDTYENEGGCYDCHTKLGWGDPAIGAADLTRPQTWLYGSTREAVAASVREGRAGVSPAFARRLTPRELRDVSIYTLSLARTRKYI